METDFGGMIGETAGDAAVGEVEEEKDEEGEVLHSRAKAVVRVAGALVVAVLLATGRGARIASLELACAGPSAEGVVACFGRGMGMTVVGTEGKSKEGEVSEEERE
jgi:hypothetical protein